MGGATHGIRLRTERSPLTEIDRDPRARAVVRPALEIEAVVHERLRRAAADGRAARDHLARHVRVLVRARAALRAQVVQHARLKGATAGCLVRRRWHHMRTKRLNTCQTGDCSPFTTDLVAFELRCQRRQRRIRLHHNHGVRFERRPCSADGPTRHAHTLRVVAKQSEERECRACSSAHLLARQVGNAGSPRGCRASVATVSGSRGGRNGRLGHRRLGSDFFGWVDACNQLRRNVAERTSLLPMVLKPAAVFELVGGRRRNHTFSASGSCRKPPFWVAHLHIMIRSFDTPPVVALHVELQHE